MEDNTTQLRGRSIIGSGDAEGRPAGRRFRAVDPRSGGEIEPAYEAASERDVTAAARLAADAFREFAARSGDDRAAFLRRIAHHLESRRYEVVGRGGEETALPEGRLRGELARTTNQVRMFAALVENDAWRDARIDRGDPAREPAPKPDVRSLRRAIGPVAIFGASNFPLAFSVAGGDTASALAAGCPVIVKAHPGHPGTSEVVGLAIVDAVWEIGLPRGVFSLLFDDGHNVGARLVQTPEVKAVAFTGSRAGGDALVRRASQRPHPIPVFAEMGSINPIFILPDAARVKGAELAEGLHGSFTLGVGQFCTNPGVVLLPTNVAGDALMQALADRTRQTEAGTMLTSVVCRNYGRGIEALEASGARRVAVGGTAEATNVGVAALWEVDVGDALREPDLLTEVFGPSTLVVRYDVTEDLERFASALEGQLTATVHAQNDELEASADLIELLADRAGRVVVNGFPTGVEVGPAMVHGGPYPATSDGRSTSVGTRAIERFTRLVAYQNVPHALLPRALRDSEIDS